MIFWLSESDLQFSPLAHSTHPNTHSLFPVRFRLPFPSLPKCSFAPHPDAVEQFFVVNLSLVLELIKQVRQLGVSELQAELHQRSPNLCPWKVPAAPSIKKAKLPEIEGGRLREEVGGAD